MNSSRYLEGEIEKGSNNLTNKILIGKGRVAGSPLRVGPDVMFEVGLKWFARRLLASTGHSAITRFHTLHYPANSKMVSGRAMRRIGSLEQCETQMPLGGQERRRPE